jgi:hypothetical protein
MNMTTSPTCIICGHEDSWRVERCTVFPLLSMKKQVSCVQGKKERFVETFIH